MLKQENTMQSFNLIKIIFFMNVNFLFLTKKLFLIKIYSKKVLEKKSDTVFLITKNNQFLKIYVAGYNCNFKKFIKKKFVKNMSFRFKKKYAIFYLKKIIKAVLLKLLILDNKLNVNFFLKVKKNNIDNTIKKKFTKKNFLPSNNIAWIYFIIVRKLLKSKKLKVKFFILFNKSHSKMNEKSKKLRRK